MRTRHFLRVLAAFLCIAPLTSMPLAHARSASSDPPSPRAVMPGDANTCALAPLALHADSVSGKTPGAAITARGGVLPGDADWLSWTGALGTGAFVRSLTPPGDSATYRNPADPADHALSIGDPVRARLTVPDAASVRAALDKLKATDTTVPLWDQVRVAGAGLAYHVDGFARVRLLGYTFSGKSVLGYYLPGQVTLSARFLGYAGCGSEPRAEPVVAQTNENQSVQVTLRAAHRHATPLLFQPGAPAHGTLGAPSTPVCTTAAGLTTCSTTVIYTPNAGYHGADAFTYTATDGRLASAPATVSIAVGAINHAPAAQDDLVTTPEDTATAIAVLANDADADGDALAVSALGAPAHGTAILIADGPDAGKIRYTPAQDYHGGDSFTYTVTDGQGGTATATVLVTVAPVNDRPHASASPPSLTLDEDSGPHAVTLQGTDVETAAADLTLRVTTLPVHGQLRTTAGALVTRTDVFTGSVDVTYTPDQDYSGDDSLTFAVADSGDGDSPALADEATVPIVVRPVDDAPVAAPVKVDGVHRGTPVSATLSAADVDSGALGFAIVDQPAHGTLSTPADATCAPTSAGAGSTCTASVTYTADAGYRGADAFTYAATDGALDSAPATVTIGITNAAPVAQPQAVTTDEDTSVDVTLAASDPDGDALVYTIASGPAHGHLSTVDGNTGEVTYTPDPNYNGPDSFTFTASDGLDTSEPATVTMTITAVNDAPAFTGAAANTAQTIDEGQGLSALAATDPDGDALTYTLVSGTLPLSITLQADGTFSGAASDTAAGSYSATVSVSDSHGGSTVTTLLIVVNDAGVPLPPDPSTVASPVEQGVATDLASATSFLYSGPDPIQTGVVSGAIQPRQAAVLRGVVTGRDGKPLAGVAISVKDHPEYGATLTQRDGAFDLAVNGGVRLTLDYRKDGYLPVQRPVDAPRHDYARLPDVVLVALDPHVTAIDLSSGQEAMQVAQGSPVVDADGRRTATLLFPQGTSARMTLPDGTTAPLSSLHVRATEYTVGANGPAAMPGPLPASSGYTYAAELSVDEALQAGATDVRFSQAVPLYVENFVGFPVGGAVPVGYYDRGKAAWVAAPNGRVVKILSVTNGKADLDVTGSGTAADAATLAALGISDAERAQLAALYNPGQELWRVPIMHFTPWDCNWPYTFPTDATTPNQPVPEAENPVENDDKICGSIIGCVNQTLGEAIDVTGTPFTLHYSSDRSRGYRAAYALEIPLSGASLPASLKRIDVQISVAGRSFERSFAPSPNQSTTFEWDGKDAYGREVVGRQTVNVRIGYVYGAVYVNPQSGSLSFGAFGEGVISGNRATSEITLWQNWQGRIGAWIASAQDLGGWSLDVHHAYDPEDRTLLLGNGDHRSAQDIQTSVITTLAGNGKIASIPADTGEGGRATSASLTPNDVEVGPDGSVYIADTRFQSIRKVSPDGIITRIAGVKEGYSGFTGDGGPATSARLSYPTGIALGPDGSLYIADSLNSRIRKVAPDGIITTVAGNGALNNNGLGSEGDGLPATQAPLGRPEDVAVGPDGSLYIAETQTHAIRKVAPDGVISKIAGRPCATCIGFQGDGGPALKAWLRNPTGIEVGADGSVYFVQGPDGRVRRISPDGVITTVAGGGTVLGDGGPATAAQLAQVEDVALGPTGELYITAGRRVRVVENGIIRTVAGSGQPCGGFPAACNDGGAATAGLMTTPNGVAVGPDGSAYVGDGGANRVRRIASALPGAGAGDVAIPSDDGSEVYVFDAFGRHQRTLDALTGAVRLSFTYDAEGRLTSVTDLNGRVTTIERTPDGHPTGILAPTGERTVLEQNADGYLSRVTNPANETVTLTYGANGLLTGFTRPEGGTSTFSYDPSGLLIKDEGPGPDSSYTLLSRTSTANGHTVAATTAEGRTTSYEIENLPSGEIRRTTTDPSGLRTVTLTHTDGSQVVTSPDGATMTTVPGPDPRWGMQAPFIKTITRVSPKGITTTAVTTHTATLADPANPLSLTAQTDSVAVNSRPYTTTYDAASGQITVQSTEGRRTVMTLDAKGRVVAGQTPGTLPIAYSYDDRGRLGSVSQGGRVWTYAYDAHDRLKTLTDPLGHAVGFTRDLAGRITEETLADGRVIVSAYDRDGNLSSITPPGQPAHAFAHTPADLLASYTAPQAGTDATQTDHSYNRDRQVTLVTRPGGETVSTGYDAAGRPITVTLPGAESVGYAYDAGTGAVQTVTAPDGGTLTYGYDGALPTSQTWAGAVAGSVGRTYTPDLRVGSDSVDGANGIPYSYDRDGLLTAAGALTATRDAQSGFVTGTTLGVVGTAQGYDPFGATTAYSATAGGTALLADDYARDDLGRVAAMTETVAGRTSVYAYTYDPAGRLTDVATDGTPTAHYGYDANGNRTTYTGADGTPLTAAYDAQDRLTRYGNAIYAYTPAGELTSKTAGGQMTGYSYDALGNLRSVRLPDGRRIAYVVDGAGRRIGKKVNGALVQGFLYDGARPLAELDGNNAVVSRFVYGTRASVPDYMIKGGTTYRIVSDQLGSPRLVVDTASGAVVQQMDYDPFGRVLRDSNPGFQPFGFAGGLYDADTGLVRFGARDYDAETGRWTAKDPILFAGGQANLYAYTGNDPVNASDPSGLAEETECASAQDSTDNSWTDDPTLEHFSPWENYWKPKIDKKIGEWAQKWYEEQRRWEKAWDALWRPGGSGEDAADVLDVGLDHVPNPGGDVELVPTDLAKELLRQERQHARDENREGTINYTQAQRLREVMPQP